MKQWADYRWEEGNILFDNFHKACDACGLPYTKRQASKLNKKKGLAYKSCH